MENVTMTPTATTPGVVVSERDNGGFYGHHSGNRGLESKDLTAIVTPFLTSDIKENAIHVKDSHIAIERVRADNLFATERVRADLMAAQKETNTLITEHAHRTRELIRELDADRTKSELADMRGKLLAAAAGKVAPVITA